MAMKAGELGRIDLGFIRVLGLRCPAAFRLMANDDDDAAG